MNKYFKDDMDVMCRKGFYPYEWMDDADKFNHNGLPDIKEFYNNLKQESLSDSDKHATEVYDRLKCKSFKDYHMAYLNLKTLERLVIIIMVWILQIIYLRPVSHGMQC